MIMLYGKHSMMVIFNVTFKNVMKSWQVFFQASYLEILSVSRLYSNNDGMTNEYRADGGKRTDWGNQST